jgi:hypothetical protein
MHFRAASVRELEANVFYRVMSPKAANRHIPYPLRSHINLFAISIRADAVGDTLLAYLAIEGPHRRWKASSSLRQLPEQKSIPKPRPLR